MMIKMKRKNLAKIDREICKHYFKNMFVKSNIDKGERAANSFRQETAVAGRNIRIKQNY